MIWARVAAAAVASGAIACLSLSCTAIIGGLADEDHVDAVDRMCACNHELSFLGVKESCVDYLSGQFAGMTAAERTAWLQAYDEGCRTCDKVLDCFYRAPVCKSIGCTVNAECCGARQGEVCDAGKCQ